MKSKLGWLLVSAVALLLNACVVVPAQPGYMGGPGVVVAPPPVVVHGYWGYYGHRRW